MAYRRTRRRQTIVVQQPPAAPKPAAPAPAKPDFFGDLLKFVGVVVLAIGGITLATPWLGQVLRPAEPLPAPGLICWRIDRETSAGREHDHVCEPAHGYHLERWPGIADPVPVPDRALVVRQSGGRD
jgi:hypothetical protein